MRTFLDMFLVVLKAVPTAMITPFVSYIFWVIVLLVFSQYRRVESMERHIYGVPLNKALPQTLQAIGYGLAGGILGTLIMVYIGVSPYSTSFAVLLVLALSLYLVHPRFVCFSYAAAILSILHLITGWPDLYVPGLIAIVAILHVTESFLMAISGASCSTPLYVKNKAGQVVPGFSLQRFWPIPIAVLVLGIMPEVGEGIAMPEWWPLVLPPASVQLDSTDLAFFIFPVVAALGYSDMAVTMPPRKKCLASAANLTLYSTILLGLAVASSHVPLLQWVAALFSGLGHEAVVYLGSRREMNGQPYLRPPSKGIMVMGVLPGMPAHEAGIGSGDVILQVDGEAVNSARDLEMALEFAGNHVHLTVERNGGRGSEYLRSALHNGSLGIVPVPNATAKHHAEMSSPMPLKRIIARLWRSNHS